MLTLQSKLFVFICNGTGGLVLKLVLATLYGKEEGAWAELCRLIVFIATPHHGSVALAEKKEELDIELIDFHIDQSIRRQLKPNGPFLEELNHRFRIASLGIPIRCYYETIPCDQGWGNQQILVERWSADLNFSEPSVLELSFSEPWCMEEDDYDAGLRANHKNALSVLMSTEHHLNSLSNRICSNTASMSRSLETGILKDTKLLQCSFETGGTSQDLRHVTIIERFIWDYLFECIGLATHTGTGSPSEPDAKSSEPYARNSKDCDWYHTRCCAAAWVSPLLRAMALKEKDPELYRNFLTDRLWTVCAKKIRQESPYAEFLDGFFKPGNKSTLSTGYLGPEWPSDKNGYLISSFPYL